MSATLERPLGAASRPAAAVRLGERAWDDSRYQAFMLMRAGYTVLPIAFGIHKFFNALVSWPKYLADWIDNIAPGTAQQVMYFVGGVEMLAGLLVRPKPRYGPYIVAAWAARLALHRSGYRAWADP